MTTETPLRSYAVDGHKPSVGLEFKPEPLVAEPVKFRERSFVPWLMAVVDIFAAQFAFALRLFARHIAAPWLTRSIGPETYRGMVLGLLALPLANWVMGLYPGYGLGPVERVRRRVIAAGFTFLPRSSSGTTWFSGGMVARRRAVQLRFCFLPTGFAQMVMPDGDNFNNRNYRFDYIRREFLGEVRCLVFDVSPIDQKAVGRFIGRIWVEDREMNIVRFNGTYTHSSPARLYFHFDSWRVNVSPGEWVPAFIYVEESKSSTTAPKFPRFKAQTRLWGYNIPKNGRLEELTSIAIETENEVKDRGAVAETTPLESQRSWERQAETNIIERLEKSGILALPGPVDEVLNTVVNNLISSGNLGIEAKCRVLLPTPLETFSVGQTIVISRGLLDVLPDEASLATALAAELAHIALGHRNDTHFASYDRTMLPDEELLNRLQLTRPPEQIAAAAEKTFAMLSQSHKMGNASLFLKALASRATAYPNLIRANLGNQIASGQGLVRLQSLAQAGPALDEAKLDQIAALPLGSRIRVDPWTNRISLREAKPVSLLSARDKLPFEITPFMVPLSRLKLSLPSRAEPIEDRPPGLSMWPISRHWPPGLSHCTNTCSLRINPVSKPRKIRPLLSSSGACKKSTAKSLRPIRTLQLQETRPHRRRRARRCRNHP